MDKQVTWLAKTMIDDQAIAAAISFARVVAAFYRTLTEDGVEQFQAGQLTKDFQEAHIDKMLWPRGHGLFGVAPKDDE